MHSEATTRTGSAQLLRESLRAVLVLLEVLLSQAHQIPREKGLLSCPFLEPTSFLQTKRPRSIPPPGRKYLPTS